MRVKRFVCLLILSVLFGCKSDSTVDSNSRTHSPDKTNADQDFKTEKVEEPHNNKTVEAQLPRNWKIHTKVWGDLNKDGVKDVAVIIQNTDSANIILNDNFGEDTLDCNPRKLLVFFNDGGEFWLMSENSVFLPPPNDSISPCLADPVEDMCLGISKGVLKVHLHYWLSCGSWYVNNHDFKFRYQNNGFELIGMDLSELHRASLHEKSTSVNFITKKMQTFEEELSEDIGPVNEKWTRFELEKLYKLKDMTPETAYEFLYPDE